MTQDITNDWLLFCDQQVGRIRKNELILLGNVAPHPYFKECSYFLIAATTTSIYQLLDQAIIHNFKLYYRTLVLKHPEV